MASSLGYLVDSDGLFGDETDLPDVLKISESVLINVPDEELHFKDIDQIVSLVPPFQGY